MSLSWRNHGMLIACISTLARGHLAGVCGSLVRLNLKQGLKNVLPLAAYSAKLMTSGWHGFSGANLVKIMRSSLARDIKRR